MDETFPRYYDLDGTPCRVESARSLAEIYLGKGQWDHYADGRLALMTKADRINEEAFKQLLASFDAPPAAPSHPPAQL